MRIFENLAVIAAGLAVAFPADTYAHSPEYAQTRDGAHVGPVAANAENIRGLNIMLMVTSLRCRTGAHDFRAEYDMFARTHAQNLAEAHHHLSRKLVAVHGEDSTSRALDRIGVTIANSYGDGHPRLDCAELKRATFELARSQDRQRLSDLAAWLLESNVSRADTSAKGATWSAFVPSAPKLQYELQVTGSGIPQRPDGASADENSSVKIPIWLRG
ncbi:hypothetical protein FGU71_13645 [Erythrobacter insulae]|uniref:S-adenosyl-L-homocysteine hydrolase n=1 Tax=Erythrobacter insulae TaxID=2584124 RepID=A0A547P7M6_9SPHN|nr:hypothetical protein [Erythrobacter insulae]TRD10034.1 hypothetical protein FGU71_13645 [Erythrobacter insulae]